MNIKNATLFLAMLTLDASIHASAPSSYDWRLEEIRKTKEAQEKHNAEFVKILANCKVTCQQENEVDGTPTIYTVYDPQEEATKIYQGQTSIPSSALDKRCLPSSSDQQDQFSFKFSYKNNEKRYGLYNSHRVCSILQSFCKPTIDKTHINADVLKTKLRVQELCLSGLINAKISKNHYSEQDHKQYDITFNDNSSMDSVYSVVAERASHDGVVFKSRYSSHQSGEAKFLLLACHLVLKAQEEKNNDRQTSKAVGVNIDYLTPQTIHDLLEESNV